MYFRGKDLIAESYYTYKKLWQFEKHITPKEYGIAIQGKRKKKKRK